MNDKRKCLFWLIPAVLVLLAVLFFLYPRRADTILHMPESAAGIREVYFQRIEPVHETLEYFCQDYTLTAEREPELLQEPELLLVLVQGLELLLRPLLQLLLRMKYHLQ